MFGHGQIEGYREKYGMEYRYAKWNESADEGLVRGHEWRIFPLTHRRALFAEVNNFLLYDFFTPEGYVNEDVFAYSNGVGDERALVIYHNKYADTRGWIKVSAAYMDKASGRLFQKTLAEGLRLPHDGYAIFKDYVSGLEYIRPCRELVENGLFAVLGAYQCHVFLDWRFVSGEQWQAVHEALNGAGIQSVQDKHDDIWAQKKDEEESNKTSGKKKRISSKISRGDVTGKVTRTPKSRSRIKKRAK